MTGAAYEQRRQEIEHYFDRTAAQTWARLTSDAPVSGIRQTVREGRAEMRDTLLSWLSDDLSGARILDAGCGPGALSFELARRGADVVAIDLSATLVQLAHERMQTMNLPGSIDFRVGDMRGVTLGLFDHVVAMDSLIHYSPGDGLNTLKSMAENVSGSIVFTFAPRTRMLAAMHAVGQLFPRGNRSPSIVPVAPDRLQQSLRDANELTAWELGRSSRVNRGFYISQAQEISRTC